MNRIIRLALCVLTLVFLFAFAGVQAAQADGLEVHFINVGRNDAILIRCGGESAFIDSGTYGWGEYSTGYLRSQGVQSLKYYIGTHAHLDHVGGAPVILANFNVGTVIQPHSNVRKAIEASVETAAERQAVANANYQNLTVGQQIQVGSATITCLGPLSVLRASIDSADENDNSLVLMLSYGSNRFLLSADATSTSMKAIEAAGPGSLRADVYKNAHHNGATKESLIAAIRPKWTVFSTAAKYMPAKDYLEMLSRYGSQSLITTDSHSGHIIMTSDGSNISVRTQHSASSISLNKSSMALYIGKSETLKATVKPSGRYKTVTYVSDNPAVATVSASGKVTGVSQGTTTIRAIEPTGPVALCQVTVWPQTLTLKKSEITLETGKSTTVSWSVQPSGGKKPVITWASADETVARVDQKGKITGVYPGTTTVTATLPNGQVSSVSVTVSPVKVSSIKLSPSKLTLSLGESGLMKAKISPSNATWKEVAWSIQDESIATVSQDGTVTAVSPGTTTLVAFTQDGKTKTAKITVKPLYVKKILISDEPAGLVAGVSGRNQAQLSYAVQPANASIQQVKWSSSDSKVLSVDERGVVTAHKAGKATITCKATDGSGKYAKVKITVAANELSRKVYPVNGQLVIAPKKMRYTGGQLEITMAFVNRTGAKVSVPGQGVLTVVLPDGTQVPALQVGGKQSALKNGSTKTVKFNVPLSDARLYGLDLSRCSAVIQ